MQTKQNVKRCNYFNSEPTLDEQQNWDSINSKIIPLNTSIVIIIRIVIISSIVIPLNIAFIKRQLLLAEKG